MFLNQNFFKLCSYLICLCFISACSGNSANDNFIASNSCVHNGALIPNGSSSVFYASETVPNGNSCQSGNVQCNGGVLTNEIQFPFQSCSILNSLNCFKNGVTIPNESTQTFYNSSSVPFGQSCESAIAQCSNGTITGASNFAFTSCTVDGPTVTSCTQDPKLFIGSNYRQSNGNLVWTSSALVKVESTTGVASTIDLSESLVQFTGQFFGFRFGDINVLSDEEPIVTGSESGYTFRGRDCYSKSFYWEKNSNPYLDFTEFLFSAVTPIATPFMYNDTSRGSSLLVSTNSILTTINFSEIQPNPAQGMNCPLRTPTPQLSGVQNLSTGVITYYSQPTSASYLTSGLSKLDNEIYAAGIEDNMPIYWRNGTLIRLPNPNSHSFGTLKTDTSKGAVYFAGLSAKAVNQNKLFIWKNGSLFKEVLVPDREYLLDFYVDDGNRYSFIQFQPVNGSNSYYYLKNETQKINIDLSLYNQCRGLHMHAFNNKVYVTGHCSLPGNGTYTRHVVWIDGVHTYSLDRFTSIPNASDSELKVGCQTANGFKTKLD